MKVAIVHYWFITRRGGEKVVESILKLFPEADIYTLFYDEEVYGQHISNHKIVTSSLNNKVFRKHYQKIFPLYPFGVKSLKLQDNYDLIISSESGPAKGIKIPNGCPHICYIHSPMRYCWGFTDEYLKSMSKYLRPLASFFFNRLRKWDLSTIDNVDYYVANSNNVAQRVSDYYNKTSIVIHPPIELALFEEVLPKYRGEIYISFGAITPYKRIDLLVETFNTNGKELIIIGDGSERQKLEKKAKDNIRFYGSLEWDKIEDIFSRAKALIFPGEEDFGMIPLEVMAYGIPVLAYKKGGALETVVENRSNIEESSGMFFDAQSSISIQECINSFEKVENRFNRQWIKKYARSFGEDYFLDKFKSFIKEKLTCQNDS